MENIENNERDPRIDEYKAKLDALDAKVTDWSDSAKAKWLSVRGDVNNILEKWKNSTKEKWDDMKGEADAMWTAVEEKFKERF